MIGIHVAHQRAIMVNSLLFSGEAQPQFKSAVSRVIYRRIDADGSLGIGLGQLRGA